MNKATELTDQLQNTVFIVAKDAIAGTLGHHPGVVGGAIIEAQINFWDGLYGKIHRAMGEDLDRSRPFRDDTAIHDAGDAYAIEGENLLADIRKLMNINDIFARVEALESRAVDLNYLVYREIKVDRELGAGGPTAMDEVYAKNAGAEELAVAEIVNLAKKIAQHNRVFEVAENKADEDLALGLMEDMIGAVRKVIRARLS